VVVMTTWRRGNQMVFSREQDLELRLDRLLVQLRTRPPQRVPGAAVFLSANPSGAPSALLTNLRDNGVLHEHVLLLTVRTGEVPHVPSTNRFHIEELGEGIFRGTIHFGFMESTDVPEALAQAEHPAIPFDARAVPYFVNRTRVLAAGLPGMAAWRERLYTILRQNAASPVDFFCLPPARVFEIGTSVEV
jgi:KUP system potassium uptake protein